MLCKPWKNKTHTPGNKCYYKIIYVLNQFSRVEPNGLPSINSCMGSLGMQQDSGRTGQNDDILILRVNFDGVSLKLDLCLSYV